MSHDSALDLHPNSVRKRWWRALKLIGIMLILLLGLGFLPKRGRDRGQAERVSSARQIGLALYDFEQAYGSFPDASTAKIRTLAINKDGDVILNGKKLFDPTNPIWEGRPPVIAWPE